MISKEKLVSLTNYKNQMEERLKAEVPESHKDHKQSYHNFLKNEIRLVNLKLEDAKLEGVK